MILTKDNIQEWKAALDIEMEARTGMKDFQKCLPDSEWLNMNMGYSVDDAVDSELSYWNDEIPIGGE